jgi:hypothetical protein
MAGGIDWFRWHHGTVTDQKFHLIAKKASASVGEVLAVWACLLEAGSMSADRGNPGKPDVESMDCALGYDDGKCARIYQAIRERSLIDEDGRIAAWNRRQPKREREDDNSTGRVQAFRDRKRQETPTAATERQETPREEERREEVSTPTSDDVGGARPAVEAPALALVGKKSIPDCPHLAVLTLWGEVLPALPQHSIARWKGKRADHLRARWRETAVEKGWQSQDDGLAYLRKLFAYVAKSPFLMGKVPPKPGRGPFELTLAWLVGPENWTKVIEGEYHREAA